MSEPHRLGAGVSRVTLAACLLALFLPREALAWGQSGHRVVAEIAERHLEPAVRAELDQLLDGYSLPEISTWADDVRSFPAWECGAPFHYVTVTPGAAYPDRGVPEGDAVEALVFYADLAADPGTEPEARRRALKWVVHLVGDLHQPLHSGRGCDEGGNWIRVEWFGEAHKLHSVWDSQLIEFEDLSFTEFADFADHADAGEIAAYQDSTPLDWVREAQQLLDGVYTCHVRDRCPCFCGGCEDGRSPFGGCLVRECELMAAGPVRLGYGYRSWALPMIHDLVVKGGARLAGMLSWILSEATGPPAAYRQMRDAFHQLPQWQEAAETLRSCGGTPPGD